MANINLKLRIFMIFLVSLSTIHMFIGLRDLSISTELVTVLEEQDQVSDALDEQRYGVIGILSADKNLPLRDKHRKIFANFKSSNVLIRFLLDSPSKTTVSESKKYADIVFLNTSNSGIAAGFGEKLSRWLNISSQLFPNAYFVGKMDDDVYVCDHTFKFIWRQFSPTMCLGWASNAHDQNISKLKRIMDEQFVVLGKGLVKRITHRRYCYDLNNCDKTRDLYDTDYGGTSLGIWLSIYDDVKSFEISNFVIHNNSFTLEKGMCQKYLLLHRIKSPEILEKTYQEQVKIKRDLYGVSTTGVTGIVFEGMKTRTFYGPSNIDKIRLFNWRENVTCKFWGVLTTIHLFNAGIQTVSNEMCLVIVADTKTPQDTYKNITSIKFVKFLSIKDQEDLLIRGLEIMTNTPWNHFGRKNVGYVYAIMHGAKSIFDFDDDNFITDTIPSYKEWYIAPAVRAFNPYPSYIELEDIPWPRGYPLSDILNASTFSPLRKMQKMSVDNSQIGIIQSLANHNPDVDAIWRLTRKLPMTFFDNISIILQSGTFSPYNAQATLHYALWGLFLPVSVHGRVSDIWRSYITQRLMWDVKLNVGFVSPFVKQIRNIHNIKADFNSEIPLYVKSEALINMLYNWKGKSDCLEERMIELYIELYEREFVEYSDVILVQKWVRTLKQIQYKFPPLFPRVKMSSV